MRESIIIPILQMQKLRHRSLSNLPKDRGLVSGRAKVLSWFS